MERPPQQNPIIIIGAGLSGLLLAQYLRKFDIPYLIFERDGDLTTRGVGWGLTLHWSLPALRSLLPQDLVDRLPEAYVDRGAVERGEMTAFPFFDLSTGELKAAAPKLPELQRIRVARKRLRQILATGIDVQWGKAFRDFEQSGPNSVTVSFDDGSTCTGSLLIGCDGANSRIRRELFPDLESHRIPIGVLGVKLDHTPEEMKPLQELDPIFFQGTASRNNTYVFFSMLDAPGNSVNDKRENYSSQIVVSWPFRPGFFDSDALIEVPSDNSARLKLIKTFAQTWAEPFRSIALNIPDSTEAKHVDVYDWAPPKGLRGSGLVALLGDAFHTMAMYRGEGANHALVDVLHFIEQITPELLKKITCADKATTDGESETSTDLRLAIDKYEDVVTKRAHPAVLASRRACMDAHQWTRFGVGSPLLSRRVMDMEFEDESLSWD
ncbi:hypothetical protein B0T17DRAFT_511099 [Bombardia bombarda]|uniref:FAD-binding domain-containing protein n=1 Tax=Bombardia bombarda TaxID=252184 RepID=A0AA39WH73_9PEZI|nr:hypothetical protein B0T17DRAFT_511099 [Bombardia bombarda]